MIFLTIKSSINTQPLKGGYNQVGKGRLVYILLNIDDRNSSSPLGAEGLYANYRKRHTF